MCVCGFEMKVPRSPLPGKSLEQARKAREAKVPRACRAGAAPGAKRGRRRWPFLRLDGQTDRRTDGVALPGRGAQDPAGVGSPAWPSGTTASGNTCREKGLMLSLNATKVQSYNIWDFSSNANFYRFFFFLFMIFFIFCFPLIFLL